MASETCPSELRWLVERAQETRDLPVFAFALLEHLAAALSLELAGLLLSDASGREFYHYSKAPITPVELAGLRARMSGLADVEEHRVLLRPFRLRDTDGALYLEPVPPERRGEAEAVIGPALALLDLLGGLAAAREEAAHDPLTGLMNRRSLAEGLGAVIEQGNRYGTSFSVAMIDLNNFKWFNDTYGHTEGDLLLKQLARVLRSSVRRADLVARWGGDEFLLVLPHTGPEQAEALLRRVASELDQFLRRYDTGGMRLGFSAGASYYPEDGRDVDTLIRRADERLYQVKESLAR